MGYTLVMYLLLETIFQPIYILLEKTTTLTLLLFYWPSNCKRGLHKDYSLVHPAIHD